MPTGAMPDGWSVTELNRYVRQSLETDYRLQNLRVFGEISGFRAYPSGHWYFTLKDSGAQVSCVMWRGRAERQRVQPRDGQFQLDVAWIQPVGAGALYQDFVRLKAQLEAEGLFAPERKRPLPARPHTIGLVTSPAGAALRDILNILRRRNPLLHVILAPTLVQGPDAPDQIAAALLACAGCTPAPEAIILARGGGALEDLWCFNDERVARAIAASPVPVISGVGHETDFTIADFAADLRAPTPSAAAELVTAVSLADLQAETDALVVQMAAALHRTVQDRRWTLAEKQAQLSGLSPRAQLRGARQQVDDLTARAATAWKHRLSLERERLHRLVQALHGINPTAVLSRGYAVVSRPSGEIIRRAAEVAPGDSLNVRVSEGGFGVEVKSS